MMPQPRLFDLQTLEQSDTTLIARMERNGANITQAVTSAITYIVKNSSGTTTSSGSLVVADVVFNALQLNSRWDRDSTGYNFLGVIPAACFPLPGHYIVEVKFTFTSGSPGYLRSRVFADSLISV